MHVPLLSNTLFSLFSLLRPNDTNKLPFATPPPLIPRKVMFSPADFSGVSLSPDGKWLSWIAPINTVSNIWVRKMPDGDPHNITYETGRGIPSASWIFDNESLLYAQDRDGNENWRLYTINVNTGFVRVLSDTENVTAEILGYSIRTPYTMIIGLNNRNPSYHDAWILDLKTGNKTLLFENDYFGGYLIDDDLKIRMLFNETDEGGENFYKYDNGTLTLYRQVDFENAGQVSVMGFDETGEILYWMDNDGTKDMASLYAMEYKTGKRTLLYEPKNAAISGVTFHPITQKPISVNINYAKPTRVLLDKAYQEDFDVLQKLLPNHEAPWIVDYSIDFTTWIVAPHSDINTTNYYFYNRTAKVKQITYMFNSKKSFFDYTFAPMHSFEVPVSDGFTELCYVTLPLESDPANVGIPMSPLPTILNVHGGPWGRDSWGFDGEAQYFANRGYAMLQCNFRSSTGFGKKFFNAGNGEWSKKMQQDLTDAVQWAIKNKIADPKKVAIYGGSYGGYAALVGLTFTPDLYACGVDIVGPSNLTTLLKSIPPYWKPGYNKILKRIGGDPDTVEGRKFLDSISPLTFADKVKRPLLIGQGSNDPRVKKAEADQIVKALRSKKIPITYAVFPNEGHGFARPENSLAFYAITEQFLHKCLGGRAEPISDDLKKSSIIIDTFAE